MSLIERVKNIIVSPKTEWEVIDQETADIPAILKGYVFPLSAAAAIAAFIGYGLVGLNIGIVKISGINWGIYHAVEVLVGGFLGVFISANVIDALAPTFGSEKNLGKSFQLVSYAYTPAWIAGLFAILPALSILGIVALYGLYLLYIGFPKLKKTPTEKHLGYFIVSLIVIIVISLIIGAIMSKFFQPLMGLKMPPIPTFD